ncbi:MAG: hypothetical protein KJO43_13645 [Phycisphaerae bacterium]|nr:hypothetical protein [Phycisphaerae bacterium]
MYTWRRLYHGLVDELDAAVGYWIGYAVPPVTRAREASAWRVDMRWVYCPRCGESVGPGEVTPTGCSGCRGRRMAWDAFVRLGRYDGDLRSWILDIKYHHRWDEMAMHLGALLGQRVRAARAADLRRAVVVPVPMPPFRRIHRGIDHAALIARGVACELSAPTANLLANVDGLPQVQRPRSGRMRRGGRGVRVRWGWRGVSLRGRVVVLVDDVRTTGATLRSAARRLRRMEPDRIVAAVLAVADPPERGTVMAVEGMRASDVTGENSGPILSSFTSGAVDSPRSTRRICPLVEGLAPRTGFRTP